MGLIERADRLLESGDPDRAFASLADAIEDFAREEEDEDTAEEVEESLALAAAATSLLSVPLILNHAGHAVEAVAGWLRRNYGAADITAEEAGYRIAKAGKKLEDRYLSTLTSALDTLASTPGVSSALGLADTSADELRNTARVLFYSIVAAAGAMNFGVAAGELGTLVGAAEAAMGGLKVERVVEGARELLKRT